MSLPMKRPKLEPQATLNHSELVQLSSELHTSFRDKLLARSHDPKASILQRITTTMSVDTVENEPLDLLPMKRSREDEAIPQEASCDTPRGDRYSVSSLFAPLDDALPESVLLLSPNAAEFCSLQCVFNLKGSGTYHLWMRWGKCGCSGRRALLGPYWTLVRALAEFDKLKDEKLRAGFVDAKGKSGWKGPVLTRSADKRVEALSKLLTGEPLRQSALKEVGYGTLPFHKLEETHIQRGYQTLRNIEQAVADGKPEEVPELTKAFYELIPHKQPYDEDGDTQIDNAGKLRTQTTLLNTLASLKHCPSEHQLAQRLTKVDHDSQLFARLKECFQRTNGRTLNFEAAVTDIFEVKDDGEMAEDETLGLWYGARTCAWGSVLTQGVPTYRECPDASFAHCAAATLSDSAARAAANCCPTRKSALGFVALCAVALGRTMETQETIHGNPLKEGLCDSVKAVGRMTADSSDTEVNGLKVLTGPVQPSAAQKSRFIFNEYLVSDPARIRVKYLFQLRFHFP